MGLLLPAAGMAAGLNERPLTAAPLTPAAAASAPVLEAAATTPAAEAAATTPAAEAEAAYVENNPLGDFEVHFLVSLPFTGAYSYAAVSVLDALVQGTFPTELRTADMWVIIGLALGSSLAVALGSAGRVPDQSRPRLEPSGGARGGPRSGADPETGKVQLVRIAF